VTIARTLGSSPTFAPLAGLHLERLAGAARREHVDAGEYVLRDGDAAEAFYLIERGHVTLAVPVDGTELPIETVGPGDVVGWSWMFPPYRWHLNARAAGPVDVIAFDAAGVRYACDRDPAFGYALHQALVRVLAERLQATRRRLLDVAANVAQ
jgi:CRP-like cAMP-binding protein